MWCYTHVDDKCIFNQISMSVLLILVKMEQHVKTKSTRTPVHVLQDILGTNVRQVRTMSDLNTESNVVLHTC